MITSKEKIRKLLEEKKYDELIKLYSGDRRILNLLISLTYDKQSLVCWHAIEAIGKVTKEIAKVNPDLVRNTIGRLLWMIRDESGGIGWSSPEILGEIVRNNSELFQDIAPIIVSFLDEEMLSAGVLWAIGRIGGVSAGLVEDAISVILPYLNNPDQTLRGLAVWALGEIGASENIGEMEKLRNDNNYITFYDEGELTRKTVGDITEEAITKLVKGQEIQ